MCVLPRDLSDFPHQTFFKGDRLKPQVQETLAVNEKFVFFRFVAWVIHILDWCPGHVRDHPGEVTDPVCFGHLVKDVDPFTPKGRIVHGQF